MQIFHLTGTPTFNGFFCGDESINRPYQSSTVPTVVLYYVGFTVPFAVIVAVEAWTKFRKCE